MREKFPNGPGWDAQDVLVAEIGRLAFTLLEKI
jgi:hypothetical protein